MFVGHAFTGSVILFLTHLAIIQVNEIVCASGVAATRGLHGEKVIAPFNTGNVHPDDVIGSGRTIEVDRAVKDTVEVDVGRSTSPIGRDDNFYLAAAELEMQLSTLIAGHSDLAVARPRISFQRPKTLDRYRRVAFLIPDRCSRLRNDACIRRLDAGKVDGADGMGSCRHSVRIVVMVVLEKRRIELPPAAVSPLIYVVPGQVFLGVREPIEAHPGIDGEGLYSLGSGGGGGGVRLGVAGI